MIFVAGDHHAEPALKRIRSFLTAARYEFREFGYQGGADPSAKLQDFIPPSLPTSLRHRPPLELL